MESNKLITMNFDQFIKIMTVFHPQSEKDEKYKYMFRIYDYNGDGVVTQDDLIKVFELVYMKSAYTLQPPVKRPRVFSTNFMNEEYNIQL